MRTVPVIKGIPEKVILEESKDKRKKRMEERFKRLKSLGHGVHHVSSRSAFFPTAPITFTEHDLSLIRLPHNDPLIIKLCIEDCVVRRVLIDGESSTDRLFLEAFDKMKLDRNDIRPSMQPLVAFNNEKVMLVRMIKLKVHTAKRISDVNFLIVDCNSTFNVIIGRAWIHLMKVVMSTLHQVMRCQSPDGTNIIDIPRDQEEAKKCSVAAIKSKEKVVDEPIISD